MKNKAVTIVGLLLACIFLFAQACHDECDDLEDTCKHCSDADMKSECKSVLSSCEIVKGPARKDCCGAVLDQWEAACE
jgi:hypothetical protein